MTERPSVEPGPPLANQYRQPRRSGPNKLALMLTATLSLLIGGIGGYAVGHHAAGSTTDRSGFSQRP